MTQPGTRHREAVDTRAGTADQRPSSTAVRRDDRRRKSPLGWLPWLLGALILLLLGLMLAAGIGTSRDHGKKGAGSTGSSQGGTGSTGSGSGGSGSGGSGSGGSGGAAGSSTLTAGGQDLLASPQRIGSLAGQQATGMATVQQVVADEGFWVGKSATDRVFVYLEPSARKANGESKFQVKEGQTVQLKGSVKPLDTQLAERIGVTPDEGLAQLQQQKAYVDTTQISLRSS